MTSLIAMAILMSMWHGGSRCSYWFWAKKNPYLYIKAFVTTFCQSNAIMKYSFVLRQRVHYKYVNKLLHIHRQRVGLFYSISYICNYYYIGIIMYDSAWVVLSECCIAHFIDSYNDSVSYVSMGSHIHLNPKLMAPWPVSGNRGYDRMRKREELLQLPECKIA